MPRTLVSWFVLAATATIAVAQVPSPTVEGPVTGGNGAPFLASTTFDLALAGYHQAEYFISGTATAFTSAGPLSSDGRWTVTASGTTAAYKTRILVYRPTDRKKFKGTVAVEWLNVSGGLDAAPDWLTGHVQLIREGMAWVGVSAQFTGVEGGPGIGGLATMPIKTVDPARYGSLVHPGDSFSYDIFSQAAQAIRQPAGLDSLGDLKVKKVIAVGESQSALRMVTYINAIQPAARLFDGFLVHSRFAGGAALSQSPQPSIATPVPTHIRDDLRVPVMVFETESDVANPFGLGYYSDRQPDSGRFRLWEVAGTAHADRYTVALGMTDLGDSPAVADVVEVSAPLPGIIECPAPINSGPQHFVLHAALHALDRWVRRGTPPPRAPRLEVVPGPPPSLVRDEHGNAVGGIRTPAVDAPVATLSGEGQPLAGGILCLLFGTTDLFDAPTLAALYPDHAAYVSAVNKSAKRAVRAGFLLKPDARLIKAAAAASDVGN